MFIFRVMNAVPYSNQQIVQDVIACLHSYFTCNLLIGLAILHSYKQFGGRPIECMTPLGFNSAWNEYTENYCFSSSTYYVSFKEQIVDLSNDEKKNQHISYYQWMPFFLLFQAACFKFPTLIWKYFAGQSGVKVGQILRLATNESNGEPTVRADNIHSLTVHLQGALRFHHRLKTKKLKPHKILRFLNMKYSSYYVSFIYLFSKLAFLINVVCQVSFLNRYLFSGKNQVSSFNVWRDLLEGNTSWAESGLFPRITWCDFEVREMGQVQNHTVQCVLLLNVFTEKVFIVLWGWYVVLASITFCNLSSWLFNFMNPRSAEHFIYNHLEMSGERVFANSSDNGLKAIQVQVDRFIDKYLRTDGIFILRLIAQHADVVFTTDLIYKLWESHYSIEKQREALRLTEQKWQEHLRRFEAIEERSQPESESIYEDEKVFSKLHNMYAAVMVPPDLTDQLIHRPRNHYVKHNETSAVTSPTSPIKTIGSRRTSYAKILRRTLSAESFTDDLIKGKYIDSSDEDEQPKSGQMSKK